MMMRMWMLLSIFLAMTTYASPMSDRPVPIATASTSIVKALQDHIDALPEEEKRDLMARDVIMSRTLMATYSYHCPINDAVQVRSFIWRALFRLSDSWLKLQGLRFIDQWGHLLFRDNEFSAFWYHRYCLVLDQTACDYVVSGYTEGHIWTRGITMELVENSDLRSVLPRVTEYCVPIGPAMHEQCPAPVERVALPCTITGIVVQVLVD